MVGTDRRGGGARVGVALAANLAVATYSTYAQELRLPKRAGACVVFMSRSRVDAGLHQRENSAGVWVAVDGTPGRSVFRVSSRGLLHKGAMVARDSQSSPRPIGAGEGTEMRCVPV